jgi:5'-3' exonuclease
MTVPGLKKLCDFFAIDRHLTQSKEALVDKLLDFLGAPNKNKLKGGGVISIDKTKASSSSSSSKKSKSSTSKNKKSKKQTKNKDKEEDDEEVDEVEKDEDEEEEEEEDNKDEEVDQEYDDVDDDKIKIDSNETPQLPNSDTLRKWVRAYVRCFHETKLTVNHALEIGSEKFGINLLPKKAELKKLLIEEL